MTKIKAFNGDKVKELRVKHGMSYSDMSAELYAKTGCKRSYNAIRDWESGRTPDADTIYFVAKLFKKPMEFFYSKK